MTLDELISQMPAGLDRCILRILSFHTGAENAISRAQLVTDCRRHGFRENERTIRACINLLRKQGQLICSAGGNGGGYFLPASISEFQNYIDNELHPRAIDLLEQEKAMKATAEAKWGAMSNQMRMI